MYNFPLLQQTFRWFGPNFGVSLSDIRELGVEGIVTACHHIPVGEIWPSAAVSRLQNDIQKHGMKWAVVESVNVHDAIKYAGPERDVYIENYLQTLKNLAKNGIHTVCYNFMPLIDWTRTDLNYKMPSGVTSLRFDPVMAAAFDLFILRRSGAKSVYSDKLLDEAERWFTTASPTAINTLQNTILAGIPGSKERISMDFFRNVLAKVSEFSKSELQENLLYFLNAIIPEAEKIGVRTAIHPDDPPFPVFGIPRIAASYEDLRVIFDGCPSPNNGLTFCSGSLGATAENDLLKIMQDFGNRIHFLHLRNIIREADGSFHEAAHLNGSVVMPMVMQAIVNEQKRRFESGKGIINIPMRPDHGQVLLSDKEKIAEFYPGYSLIGRAIALAELSGLERGIRSTL